MVNGFVMETGYPAPLTTELTLPCGLIRGCTCWHDCGGRQLTWDSTEEFTGLKDSLPLCAIQTPVLGAILISHMPRSQIYTPSTPASWDSTSSKLEMVRLLCYVYRHTASNYTRGFMAQPGCTASKLWAHWLKDLSLTWSFSVEIWEVAWKVLKFCDYVVSYCYVNRSILCHCVSKFHLICKRKLYVNIIWIIPNKMPIDYTESFSKKVKSQNYHTNCIE